MSLTSGQAIYVALKTAEEVVHKLPYSVVARVSLNPYYIELRLIPATDESGELSCMVSREQTEERFRDECLSSWSDMVAYKEGRV